MRQDTVTGETALHCAAYEGKAAVAKLLLTAGADPNAADHSGMTPLATAAMEGHEAVVALLLNKGADANATNAAGSTPLTLAGSGPVADLLSSRGGHG